VRFALLLLTACGRIGFDASASDGPSPFQRSVQAESCTVVAPFDVVADSSASAGAYVKDENGLGLAGPGSATCPFSLDTGGTLYLWVRTITIDTSSDSFFATIDGTPYELEPSGCTYGPNWHWGALRMPYNCNETPGVLQPLELTAGQHTLVLTSREGQSIIDRLGLVADPTLVPGD